MDWLDDQINSIRASRDSLAQELKVITELLQEADTELDRLHALRGGAEGRPHASFEHQAPLNGYRVGVIGPSGREDDYRQVIEALGASFAFAPSEEKLGLIDRLCSRSDGVIFVTSYTSHKVDDHLNIAARRLGVPVYRLRYRGLARLKAAAISLLALMQAYRNPELASG